jgi:hypothetical protein
MTNILFRGQDMSFIGMATGAGTCQAPRKGDVIPLPSYYLITQGPELQLGVILNRK